MRGHFLAYCATLSRLSAHLQGCVSGLPEKGVFSHFLRNRDSSWRKKRHFVKVSACSFGDGWHIFQIFLSPGSCLFLRGWGVIFWPTVWRYRDYRRTSTQAHTHLRSLSILDFYSILLYQMKALGELYCFAIVHHAQIPSPNGGKIKSNFCLFLRGCGVTFWPTVWRSRDYRRPLTLALGHLQFLSVLK